MATGTDKASYYTSISVMNDPGWTKRSKVQRYTANINSTYNIFKTLHLTLSGMHLFASSRLPVLLVRKLIP